MKPTIILVDDHRLLRAGLKSMLEKNGFAVVGEVDDGRSGMRLVGKKKPQAVITDLSMPGRGGVEFIREAHRSFPETKILVVSMHNESRFIMESFAAGASGYVLKDSGFGDIVNALTVLLSGRKYIAPEISDIVLRRAVAHWISESQSNLTKISNREREVLQMVAEGRSTKEIAASLYVSIKTVETHRRQIMTRLNLPTVADLTKFAIREGITSIQ
jgi:DNA-binding NarL/FixJ family response regulator